MGQYRVKFIKKPLWIIMIGGILDSVPVRFLVILVIPGVILGPLVLTVYNYFFNLNSIGFYIKLSDSRIEGLTGEDQAIVTVSIDAPSSCRGVVKSALVKLKEDVYIKFSFDELDPLRMCWKNYREKVVSRQLDAYGQVVSIPVPGFRVKIEVPDFKGGLYVAVWDITASDYLELYYTQVYGSEKGLKVARELSTREPEKMFELPLSIVVSGENIRFRYVNTSYARLIYEGIIRETAMEHSQVNTLKIYDTPLGADGVNGDISLLGVNIVGSLKQAATYSVPCPPVNYVKTDVYCEVYNALFWNLTGDNPSIIEPPSEWINRIMDWRGRTDPVEAKLVWEDIVWRFTVKYVFPKTQGWDKVYVLSYLMRNIDYIGGRYGYSIGGSSVNAAIWMSDVVDSLTLGGFTWNHTLGKPGEYRIDMSIPVGIIVNSPDLRNVAFSLVFTVFELRDISSGVSFLGHPLIGNYIKTIYSGVNTTISTPTKSYQARFLMIPANFTYMGDYLFVSWDIVETQDYYYAYPMFTFTPVFRIESYDPRRTWYYRYPEEKSSPVPEEYYQLSWGEKYYTYINLAIEPEKQVMLDTNNYSDAAGSNPGLVSNIMYNAVLTALTTFLPSEHTVLSFFLSVVGACLSMDYYYAEAIHVNIVLYGVNFESSLIPIEIAKETMLPNLYQYPPLKLIYWVNVAPGSGPPPCPINDTTCPLPTNSSES